MALGVWAQHVTTYCQAPPQADGIWGALTGFGSLRRGGGVVNRSDGGARAAQVARPAARSRPLGPRPWFPRQSPPAFLPMRTAKSLLIQRPLSASVGYRPDCSIKRQIDHA